MEAITRSMGYLPLYFIYFLVILFILWKTLLGPLVNSLQNGLKVKGQISVLTDDLSLKLILLTNKLDVERPPFCSRTNAISIIPYYFYVLRPRLHIPNCTAVLDTTIPIKICWIKILWFGLKMNEFVKKILKRRLHIPNHDSHLWSDTTTRNCKIWITILNDQECQMILWTLSIYYLLDWGLMSR